MQISEFVLSCRFCDLQDKEQVRELLEFGASLGEEIIKVRKKHDAVSGFFEKYNQIRKLYNQICVSLPKVQEHRSSASRERLIKKLLEQYTIEDFEKVFRFAESSAFLTGHNERGWKANFNWLANSNNFLKVLEGGYNSSTTVKPKPSYDLSLAFEASSKWLEDNYGGRNNGGG